ncbi:DUF4135 domain-containing protein [Pseudomonas akapageensis]|uniref:DUF4135 domain-containing protein n=1 Tax=Pseudomonas akapageensis TaxID=2609961 RepID=UPI00140E4C30|nr:DUF4135 domain-containing protein [Pseudomonas akapageensis]
MNPKTNPENTALRLLWREISKYKRDQIDPTSFLKAAEQDLKKLAFSYKHALLIGPKPDSQYHAFIENKLIGRAKTLSLFYSRLSDILHSKRKNEKYQISFLNGDSHNGGQRPVILKNSNERVVLKLTDPRASLLYNHCLDYIHQALEFPAPALNIEHDDLLSYQITPYLENTKVACKKKIENYGYSLGIHLCLSYFLQITDLHFENVLADDGHPYIIDTECMFYHFYGAMSSSAFRLLNTGLVAPKRSLSGIKGGDAEVSNLELHLDKNKNIKYIQKNLVFDNRIKNPKGEIIEIEMYKKHILSGFAATYKLIADHKLSIIQSANPAIISKLKTRLLIRTTAHYKTVIDRIYTPNQTLKFEDYAESTLSSFCRSGSLISNIDDALIEKEINDIIHADIPFFWACPSGRKIMHRSGIAMVSPEITDLETRIRNAIDTFSITDLESLSKLIEEHL